MTTPRLFCTTVVATLCGFTAGCGPGADVGEARVALNNSPVAALRVQSIVPVNRTVALDASASRDPDGDPLTFAFGFPGEASTRTASSTSEHVFVETGVVAVTVEVIDLRGATAIAGHHIAVRDEYPSEPDFCTTPSDCEPGDECAAGVCYLNGSTL